jgi:hypothetical protein
MAIKVPGAAHLESRKSLTSYSQGRATIGIQIGPIPLLPTRNLFHMTSSLYIIVVTMESAWTPFAELYGPKRVDAAVTGVAYLPANVLCYYKR